MALKKAVGYLTKVDLFIRPWMLIKRRIFGMVEVVLGSKKTQVVKAALAEQRQAAKRQLPVVRSFDPSGRFYASPRRDLKRLVLPDRRVELAQAVLPQCYRFFQGLCDVERSRERLRRSGGIRPELVKVWPQTSRLKKAPLTTRPGVSKPGEMIKFPGTRPGRKGGA
ncbi:hypothetical protein [Hydrogenophaga sp.]|uniref:hypothetical protein n=1 Tax=Hydrogenophaga sp. TaxID=1904254 RepID=UPI0035B4F13A